MNFRRKQVAALRARITGYEDVTRDPKVKNAMHKPGSQNRKKGFHGAGHKR